MEKGSHRVGRLPNFSARRVVIGKYKIRDIQPHAIRQLNEGIFFLIALKDEKLTELVPAGTASRGRWACDRLEGTFWQRFWLGRWGCPKSVLRPTMSPHLLQFARIVRRCLSRRGHPPLHMRSIVCLTGQLAGQK